MAENTVKLYRYVSLEEAAKVVRHEPLTDPNEFEKDNSHFEFMEKPDIEADMQEAGKVLIEMEVPQSEWQNIREREIAEGGEQTDIIWTDFTQHYPSEYKITGLSYTDEVGKDPVSVENFDTLKNSAINSMQASYDKMYDELRTKAGNVTAQNMDDVEQQRGNKLSASELVEFMHDNSPRGRRSQSPYTKEEYQNDLEQAKKLDELQNQISSRTEAMKNIPPIDASRHLDTYDKSEKMSVTLLLSEAQAQHLAKGDLNGVDKLTVIPTYDEDNGLSNIKPLVDMPQFRNKIFATIEISRAEYEKMEQKNETFQNNKGQYSQAVSMTTLSMKEVPKDFDIKSLEISSFGIMYADQNLLDGHHVDADATYSFNSFSDLNLAVHSYYQNRINSMTEDLNALKNQPGTDEQQKKLQERIDRFNKFLKNEEKSADHLDEINESKFSYSRTSAEQVNNDRMQHQSDVKSIHDNRKERAKEAAAQDKTASTVNKEKAAENLKDNGEKHPSLLGRMLKWVMERIASVLNVLSGGKRYTVTWEEKNASKAEKIRNKTEVAAAKAEAREAKAQQRAKRKEDRGDNPNEKKIDKMRRRMEKAEAKRQAKKARAGHEENQETQDQADSAEEKTADAADTEKTETDSSEQPTAANGENPKETGQDTEKNADEPDNPGSSDQPENSGTETQTDKEKNADEPDNPGSADQPENSENETQADEEKNADEPDSPDSADQPENDADDIINAINEWLAENGEETVDTSSLDDKLRKISTAEIAGNDNPDIIPGNDSPDIDFNDDRL